MKLLRKRRKKYNLDTYNDFLEKCTLNEKLALSTYKKFIGRENAFLIEENCIKKKYPKQSLENYLSDVYMGRLDEYYFNLAKEGMYIAPKNTLGDYSLCKKSYNELLALLSKKEVSNLLDHLTDFVEFIGR